MSDYVLRAGSFNGLEFFTTDSEIEVGQRNVVFEYPGQDDPDVEPLGRSARRINVSFFVIGPNFIAQAKRLLDELEKPGIHELVHPWHGLIKVHNVRGRARVTTQENRMMRFSAEFVRAKEQVVAPTEVPGAALADKAAALDIAAAFALEDGYSTTGPVSLLARAEQGVQKALDAVAAASDALNVVNDVASRILAMEQNITSLVLTPANLGLQLLSAIHTVTNSNFDPKGALLTQLNILEGLVRPRSASGSKVDVQAATNDALVNMFVRCAAVAECARLVSGAATRDGVDVQGVAFDTRDEAVAIQERLSIGLDDLLLYAPDSLFPALRDISIQLAKDFRDRAPTASLTTVRIDASVPAVVLAHRLYGDATRADEIVAHNGIRNPLFVPAGEDLEVRYG